MFTPTNYPSAEDIENLTREAREAGLIPDTRTPSQREADLKKEIYDKMIGWGALAFLALLFVYFVPFN